MKIILAIATTAGLMAAGISAASADYCADQAKHDANAQAAKKTIVGTVGGCLVGKLLGGKCGGGAAVGGIGGFAIGSAQWHDAYDASYNACVAAHQPKTFAKPVVVTSSVPVKGSQAWNADCGSKYANFDETTGKFTYESYTGDTITRTCALP